MSKMRDIGGWCFPQAELPVLSIGTKQKKMLGNFDRGESYYGKDKR
jgi:hypothetical protein